MNSVFLTWHEGYQRLSKVGSGDDGKMAAMEDAEASLTIAVIEKEETSIDIFVKKDGADIETVVEKQGTSYF